MQNQLNLWSRVYCQDVARVVRRGEDISLVPTEQLVPGDLLALPPHGCTMHCDAVLLTGTCIVNESMLTGMILIQFDCRLLVEQLRAVKTHFYLNFVHCFN